MGRLDAQVAVLALEPKVAMSFFNVYVWLIIRGRLNICPCMFDDRFLRTWGNPQRPLDLHNVFCCFMFQNTYIHICSPLTHPLTPVGLLFLSMCKSSPQGLPWPMEIFAIAPPLPKQVNVAGAVRGRDASEEFRLSCVCGRDHPRGGTVTTHPVYPVCSCLDWSPDRAGGSWRQSHCHRRNLGIPPASDPHHGATHGSRDLYLTPSAWQGLGRVMEITARAQLASPKVLSFPREAVGQDLGSFDYTIDESQLSR